MGKLQSESSFVSGHHFSRGASLTIPNVWVSQVRIFGPGRPAKFGLPIRFPHFPIGLLKPYCFSKSQTELGPDCVDFGFDGAVHFNHRRPGALEAFGLPFSGGVYSHL